MIFLCLSLLSCVIIYVIIYNLEYICNDDLIVIIIKCDKLYFYFFVWLDFSGKFKIDLIWCGMFVILCEFYF